MGKDLLYTDGVIAVKEKALLKDKLLRFAECSADEAFKMLIESGFGSGAAAESVYDFEALIKADEAAIDEFIREYAPTEAEKVYLLAARDFHNAKALLKAEYLQIDPTEMLAPEGLYTIETLKAAVGGEGEVNEKLSAAIVNAKELLASENASGAEVGGIFDKALFELFKESAKKNKALKALLTAKADMTNILTALRSAQECTALSMYVAGGSLKSELLSALFLSEEEALKAFEKSKYLSFVKNAFAAKAAGRPLTEAERERDSYETVFFGERRFELKSSQPFLYYVFRRRIENANVRIVFVCLLAGMKEAEIKARLRVF